MRFISIICLIVVVTGCGTPNNYNTMQVNFQEISFSEILTRAQNSQKKILVDFWADG